MARYTTEYGELIRTNFEPLLECLATYPIQDETHRAELNEKILGRFKFREIGFETAARFVHYFRQQLAEIMPYYNRLFKVEIDKINPLLDADYTDTTDASTKGTSLSENSSGSKNVHMYSDTPQGGFAAALIDSAQTVSTSTAISRELETGLESDTAKSESQATETGTYKLPKISAADSAYMSEASTDLTTGSNSGSNLSETGAHAGRTVKGKFPGITYGTMLDDYKKAVWNIDRMILDDLEICFMGVY